jgi:hypothetical protein
MVKRNKSYLQACAKKALRELADTGAAGIVTSNSCGAETRYRVIVDFRSLADLQAFHRALLKCLRTAKELEEPEEFSPLHDAQSAGPFSHDAGGGHRVIRDSKTLQ